MAAFNIYMTNCSVTPLHVLYSEGNIQKCRKMAAACCKQRRQQLKVCSYQQDRQDTAAGLIGPKHSFRDFQYNAYNLKGVHLWQQNKAIIASGRHSQIMKPLLLLLQLPNSSVAPNHTAAALITPGCVLCMVSSNSNSLWNDRLLHLQCSAALSDQPV